MVVLQDTHCLRSEHTTALLELPVSHQTFSQSEPQIIDGVYGI